MTLRRHFPLPEKMILLLLPLLYKSSESATFIGGGRSLRADRYPSSLSMVPIEDLPSMASSLQPSAYAAAPSIAVSTQEARGVINWENPGEAIAGGITLLYILFSVAAGIKYVIKDGWRPKL